MTKTCTWKDCNQPATHPQLSNDGSEWANLCDSHSEEMEQAVTSLDPKTLVRSWILAMGGAKKAAKRL